MDHIQAPDLLLFQTRLRRLKLNFAPGSPEMREQIGVSQVIQIEN